MRNIRGVIKKDLDKIFKFPGAIFSTIILPGLMLFLIYAIMGSSFSNLMGGDTDYYNRVILINAPGSFNEYIDISEESKISYTISEEKNVDVEILKNELKENKWDLIVVFDSQFDEKIEQRLEPTLSIYGNDISSDSSVARNKINTFITDLKAKILTDRGINTNVITETYDSVADENQVNAFGLAMLLPMLIITFVFAGALGVGADAIAGEKERGTLSTLLMAPIRRNEIILGKVISTSIISLLSAVSSFVGIIASFPFAKEIFGIEGSVNYGIDKFAQLLIVIVILAMLASSIILLFSALAKSVKEATSYAMPIYIIAILTAVVSMFSKTPSDYSVYAIPIYNLAITIKGILSFDIKLTGFIIAILSNVLYITLVVVLLVRMFKSEKILFSK